MRAGVVEAARNLSLQGLPVPTSCKAVVSNADLLDLAELTRVDDLVRKGMDGCGVGLLEYREGEPLLLSECDKGVALKSRSRKGLFNKDVEAVLEKILRNRKMILGIGGVYNEINVSKSKQLGVRCKGLAAGIDLLGYRATVPVFINNVLDVVIYVLLGAKVEAVDILAASTLSNNCNVQLFHTKLLLGIIITTKL